MITSLYVLLQDWRESTNDRQKLQQAYVVGGVALLIIAGLIGLVDYSLGQLLLQIALIAIAIFFINAIVWALLTAFVLLPLSSQRQTTSSKQKTRTRR